MERLNLNYFSLFSFHILLFTLFIIATSSNTTSDNGLCSLVFCGEGTCKDSSTSILGFECDCDSGWKKIQIGPLTFPACLIPNCTVDLGCGNGSPPLPPPTPIPQLPLNFTNPCNLIWCNEGSCVPDGTGHRCQCNEGSGNLANNTQLPCFQECSFGADCGGIELGGVPSSSTTPGSTGNVTPPPSSASESGRNGASEASNSLRSMGELIVILLAATSLTLL